MSGFSRSLKLGILAIFWQLIWTESLFLRNHIGFKLWKSQSYTGSKSARNRKQILLVTSEGVQFSIPTNGIIDYKGRTDREDTFNPSIFDTFKPSSHFQSFITSFRLFLQLPWKKIGGKVIITVQIGGDLPLESRRTLFNADEGEAISSVADADKLFRLAAHDPRVVGVVLEVRPLQCGYAKLTEILRSMEYFKQSGKKLIGYCSRGQEKEYYLSLGCNEVYVPPEGGFDLRGFSAAPTFYRRFFEKVGIEPQIERIGKYKSFGDQFNRLNISEAQREVTSSILTEASNNWANQVAWSLNQTVDDVKALWSLDFPLSPEELKNRGLISGILYLNDIIELYKSKLQFVESNFGFAGAIKSFVDVTVNSKISKDFSLQDAFVNQPRRVLKFHDSNVSSDANFTQSQISNNSLSIGNSTEFNSTSDNMVNNRTNGIYFSEITRKSMDMLFGKILRKPSSMTANKYLRKMRNGDRVIAGLPFRQSKAGRRIAIINAVGSITSGKGAANSVGSDSFIKLVDQASEDTSIVAVVIRVDSPGGDALASDDIWGAVRNLASKKPVVASQVDVAASGGYYISMACDQIVSENLSLTGSIGVVLAKFNLQKAFENLGIGTELISIGRYAELFNSARSFTAEESKYFSQLAAKSYKTFVEKAAASRSMSYEAMHEVAQGRVWTGQQGLDRGLVDHIGGLSKAIEIACMLSTNSTDISKIPKPLRIDVMSSQKSFSLQDLGQVQVNGIRTLCDESLFEIGIVSPESVGCGSSVMKTLGFPSSLRYLAHSIVGYDVDILAQSIPESNFFDVLKNRAINWFTS